MATAAPAPMRREAEAIAEPISEPEPIPDVLDLAERDTPPTSGGSSIKGG